MNNTPTPRTDAAAWPETDLVEGNFSRILERELTAVTEQRDEAREELFKTIEERRQEAIKAAAVKSGLLLWQNCAEDAERELTAVTEQRDAVTLRLGDTQVRMFDAERQRDRLAAAIEAASVLIAAKGRHNTMLAYNGLRDALQSLTQNANLSDRHE